MDRSTIVLPATQENISRAAQVIRDGGLVAFPTETVYGLGANALDAVAVAKIFEAKNRPTFDPLIVHVHDLNMLQEIAEENILSKKLAEEFWPGPLTLVLKKKSNVPDLVSSGLSTVGVRIPKNVIALELIKAAGVPVAAPSANPFGYLSPTNASHVFEQLNGKVDIILDGGDCEVGVESTIISCIDDKAELLRPGGLSLEILQPITGELKQVKTVLEEHVPAPGMLSWHYSPATPLRFREENEFRDKKEIAYLFFSSPKEIPKVSMFEILSKKGDMNEAAANLFSALHRLDQPEIKIIIADAVPDTGLGLAIMDRLKKASKRPS